MPLGLDYDKYMHSAMEGMPYAVRRRSDDGDFSDAKWFKGPHRFGWWPTEGLTKDSVVTTVSDMILITRGLFDNTDLGKTKATVRKRGECARVSLPAGIADPKMFGEDDGLTVGMYSLREWRTVSDLCTDIYNDLGQACARGVFLDAKGGGLQHQNISEGRPTTMAQRLASLSNELVAWVINHEVLLGPVASEGGTTVIALELNCGEGRADGNRLRVGQPIPAWVGKSRCELYISVITLLKKAKHDLLDEMVGAYEVTMAESFVNNSIIYLSDLITKEPHVNGLRTEEEVDYPHGFFL